MAAAGQAMTYTVVWKPAAEDDLARIWNNADDRSQVSRAADTIDVILRNSPFTYSEERDSPSRVMFIEPLGVNFDVSDADCLVTVWAIWRTDRVM
jgi:plasmid stabilization system protein ParE